MNLAKTCRRAPSMPLPAFRNPAYRMEKKAAKRRRPATQVRGVPKPLDSRTLDGSETVDERPLVRVRGTEALPAGGSRRQLVQPAQRYSFRPLKTFAPNPRLDAAFQGHRRRGFVPGDRRFLGVMRVMATTHPRPERRRRLADPRRPAVVSLTTRASGT